MKKLLSVLLVLLLLFVIQKEITTANEEPEYVLTLPLILELTGDKHPAKVDGTARQTLSLSSNHRTTCVTLSVDGYPGNWQSSTSDKLWSIASTALGHRYCTTKQGDFTLEVTHDFSEPLSYWPVGILVTTRP